MTFLVVDDSRIARQRLISYLEDLNHKVLGEAVDGVEAVEKYKELSPTYVALDLEMPNMNGIEAAEKILELNSKVKIILITSIVDKKEIINAYRVGVKKVINKPFSKDELMLVIDELKANQ